MRELYSGAFKLFRNPTAHSVVGYDGDEGKAIIGLVNLMLRLLDRAEELPPPGLLPENVEAAISEVEASVGPGAASRLRMFLGKCIKIGVEPGSAEGWIPFKAYGLVKYDRWEEPRSHSIPVFHLYPHSNGRGLAFVVQKYHAKVVGFDLENLTEELTELGFPTFGQRRDLRIDLRFANDQEFFTQLYELVARTSGELEETLHEV